MKTTNETKLTKADLECLKAMYERMKTRLIVLTIIFTIALAGSNIAWLIYDMHRASTTIEEVTPERSENNNV